MSKLTAAQLNELERLEKAATKDWSSGCPEEGRLFAAGHGAEIAKFRRSVWQVKSNTQLAIVLRNAAPQLIAAARRVTELETALKDEIEVRDAICRALSLIDRRTVQVSEGPLEYAQNIVAHVEAALKERDARIAELERESDGRRKALFGVGEERRDEWIRAERAESALAERTAERDAAREALAVVRDAFRPHPHRAGSYLILTADVERAIAAIDAARAKQEGC